MRGVKESGYAVADKERSGPKHRSGQRGVVMIFTILMLLGVGAIGVSMITNAQINASVARNYAQRLQSYYAADGQITLLSQEALDTNMYKYCPLSGAAMVTTTYQAEAATLHGAVVANGNAGFTGTGYADYINSTGDYIEWSVMAPKAGAYRLGFRHALASGNRSLQLRVNGSVAISSLTFGATGSWTAWDTVNAVTSLSTGNNAIRLVANGASGPNVDCLILSDTSGPGNQNLAYGKTGFDAGFEDPYYASYAFDGNVGTRWSSEWSDNEYLIVDLGSSFLVNRVVLNWEAACASEYKVQVSPDKNNWTDVAHITGGTPGVREVTFGERRARYVRMLGIIRATVYGYSLYEFEVYGNNGGPGIDTVQMGDYNVRWTMFEPSPMAFTIEAEAFKGSGSGVRFRTPLKQYLELPSSALVNPYGSSVDVDVTFYDFHSDRSNPEFEAPHESPNNLFADVHKGMVMPYLDSDRKPILGPKPHLNYYIKYWFRAWADSAQGNNRVPNYEVRPAFKSAVVPGDPHFLEWWANDSILMNPNYKNVGHDTSFKNVVIPGKLNFQQVSGAVYTFEDTTFFPLDTLGYGIEWNFFKDLLGSPYANHNYCFTMEMHRTFFKVPGLFFAFEGDDDVWVFINNTLVMDLGGVHYPIKDTVKIDDLGLIDGQEYNFDFFYCDRHSEGSHCTITTNMLTYVPLTQSKRYWKRDYGSID